MKELSNSHTATTNTAQEILDWLHRSQGVQPEATAQRVAPVASKDENPPDSTQVERRSDGESLQDKKLSPRAFAAEWLRELLQEPRWVEDILRLAEENNIAFTTLKRAKKSIGAKSVKSGGYFGGADTRWSWRLD